MTRSVMVALADVCEINPRLPKAHPLRDDTNVSFVPMASVDETEGAIVTRHVRRFSEVKKGYTSFRDNDVLIAKITPCMENGKAAVARDLQGGYGFGSTEFHVLRATPRVLPEWIFYFLRREQFRVEAKRNFTGTAGQQRVPTSFLQLVQIPVPSLPEQRRIVDILSRAESIVRLRREAQKKAAELIPALFLDAFGDPATNPKGWPVTLLGNALTSGPQNGLYKHNSFYGDGTPILRIDAFYDGETKCMSGWKRVRLTNGEASSFAISTRDIVINRVNSIEYLGKSAIIPLLPDNAVFESNMMRMTFNETYAIPEFAIEFLQTAHARAHFLANAKRAINQASINQQDVKSLSMMLPPIAMQREFSERVRAVRGIQTQQSTATTQAEATFNALLAQVFAPV